MAFMHRENNSRPLDEFETEETRGADGWSHITQADNGQINGYGYCTQQEINKEHYTTRGGAEQDSGPSMRTTVEANGLCHLSEAGTGGQTNGSGCTTQRHWLHSGGTSSHNEGSPGHTNWTGQTNGLGKTPVERGDGQTNVFSCLTNGDGNQTNEVSGTEDISRRPDGLINAVERPNDQNNEISYPTGQNQAPVPRMTHTTNGCTWQTNGVGNPAEERSGQERGLNNSNVGCGAQASGSSQPADYRGSNYLPDEAAANEMLRYPIQEDVTCLPVQENDGEDATSQWSTRQRNQLPCPQVSGRLPVDFQIRGIGQAVTQQLTFCLQQIGDVHFNAVSATGDNEQAAEQVCSVRERKQWDQKLNRSNPQKASRKKGKTSDTFFIMEIPEVHQHRQHEVPFFSDAVATDSFEWVLGIRMYPNGVDGGRGTHVARFVHMIQGGFDDLLDWPFPGRITVSILDQSGAEIRNHISRIVQAKPHLYAFQKPAEAICRTGYGFVKFAPIQEFFSPRYVKNDKLFLKIEFSY